MRSHLLVKLWCGALALGVVAASFAGCGGESTSSELGEPTDDREHSPLASHGGPEEPETDLKHAGSSSGGNDGGEEHYLAAGPAGLPLLVGEETALQFAMALTDETGRADTYSIAVDEESPRAVLGTHLPGANFGSEFQDVRFSARASREVPLIVSVSPLEGSYFQALESGNPFQGTVVHVTEGWTDFVVPIAEMMPLGEGQPASLGTEQGSALSFVMEDSEEATLWISDVALVP